MAGMAVGPVRSDEAVVDPAGTIDLVRLRLFRNETLRWSILARGRNLGRLQKVPIVDPAADVEPAADEDAPPAPAPIIPEEDSFDDWAFGGEAGARRFREQLDGLLEKKLRGVDTLFVLTEPQRKKLQLAGKGDIRRVLELVDRARDEYARARADAGRLAELQKDLKLIELRITDGLFEDRSLFTKTLRKMFDDRQLTRKPAPSRTVR